MDLKQEAAKLQLKYLERVIAQAYAEGATPGAIDEWLVGQGIKDPDIWRARVEAMKVARLLGAQEIKNLGGRQAFRDLFKLPPIPPPVYLPRPDEFPLTETGDAEFFAKLYHDDLRYDHRQGRWLVADEASGLWLPDPIEKVTQLAVHSIRQRQAHAMQISDDQRERKAALDWAVKGESRGRLSSALYLAESTPPLADPGDGWDVNPMLLGTLNGVIDLVTGEHRKALPTERVTMHVRAAFDPTATCPLWLASMETIFHQPGSPEESARMVSFIQRALGYSITGDCREECCFFTWGIGSNGKGTMMNTLGWLMQDYYDDMPYSTLERSVHGTGIPNDVAKLDGKRFITCSEVQEFTINESRLKALTGRDPMTARFLNKEFFTFIPVGKIWIATNNKPRITGQDDGIWRRIFLIPFLNQFTDANKDSLLKDKLREELSGILNWLIQGTQLWLKEGLQPPETVKAATAQYRLESDVLQPFFDHRCVLAEGAKVQGDKIWEAYQRYAEHLEEHKRMNQKAFFTTLKRRFESKKNRVGQAMYVGIGLRDQHADAAATEF